MPTSITRTVTQNQRQLSKRVREDVQAEELRNHQGRAIRIVEEETSKRLTMARIRKHRDKWQALSRMSRTRRNP
jgi:hypothetical protein